MTPQGKPLSGLRLLIVEDEYLCAVDLERRLASQGAAGVTSAASVSEAVAAIGRETFDAAVLDVNLRGESVEPVAAALDERLIPFVFVTGYGLRHPALARFSDQPRLGKPYDVDRLIAILSELAGGDFLHAHHG